MLRPGFFTDNFVDGMFDDFMKDSFWNNSDHRNEAANRNVAAIKTDIKETETGYEIEMELPGFAKEDVQAELKDGYLTITAIHSKERKQEDKNAKYIRRERYSGHYQRTFYVGDVVTHEDIKAKFENGILVIQVPKKERKPEVEQRKFISIEG